MTASQALPDVSIVVVNWNVTSLLDGCLSSILGEARGSRLNVEILVVDNASEDRSYQDVVAKHDGVRLVELVENVGYGAACNAGAQATTGNAILFLNPDTELHPGSLDALWNAFQLSSHIGLVAPLLLNPDGTVQSMGYRFPGAVNVLCDLLPVPARLYASSLNGRIPAGNGVLPLSIDYALGAALMVRRHAFDDVGGFDESFFMYSEEVDFQRRLHAASWTRLLVPAARITHFGGQSTSQAPDRMHIELWSSRATYFARWSSPFERRKLRLAARMGLSVNSMLHPERSSANRQVAQIFERQLAG